MAANVCAMKLGRVSAADRGGRRAFSATKSRGPPPEGLEPEGLEPEGLEPEGLEPEGLDPEGLEGALAAAAPRQWRQGASTSSSMTMSMCCPSCSSCAHGSPAVLGCTGLAGAWLSPGLSRAWLRARGGFSSASDPALRLWCSELTYVSHSRCRWVLVLAGCCVRSYSKTTRGWRCRG